MTVIKTAIPIALAPVRWPLSSLAETTTSDHVSASCYRRPEDVGVSAVVIAELKLSDVQRHVFGADLVIGTTTPCNALVNEIDRIINPPNDNVVSLPHSQNRPR